MQPTTTTPWRPRPAVARALARVVRATQLALAILGAISWVA